MFAVQALLTCFSFVLSTKLIEFPVSLLGRFDSLRPRVALVHRGGQKENLVAGFFVLNFEHPIRIGTVLHRLRTFSARRQVLYQNWLIKKKNSSKLVV